MFRTYLFIILTFISFDSHSQKSVLVDQKNIDLAIGIDEIKKFEYKFNTKVSIGNESLIKLTLRPSRQEITFRGLKPGKTSVTIRDRKGDVRDKFIVNITNTGKSQTVAQLRELIGDVQGIEIGIKGDRVYVEGELVVPDQIGKVATVLADYKDVLALIEISPHTQREIARIIQDELSKNGMRDVTVRVVNKTFWLEGVVNSQGKSDLAIKIAEAFIPPKFQSLSSANNRVQEVERAAILNFISVNEKKDPPPPAKQVKITAQFVELSKDYKRIFGFKWAPLMTNSGSISLGQTESNEVSSEQTGTLAATISQLFPKLSTAKEAGYARVIQSGMVITKADQQASISKSKSIPFAVGTGEFSQAQSATLSFNLNVTPSVQGEEKIELKQLNIAVALPAGYSNGNPITTNNSITTNIVVKNKQSAAIGGIVQNSSTTSYDKDDPHPYGDITSENPDSSVLFNFIRSKGYITEKSQFVVFVTPEVIEAASSATAEIQKKFKKRAR